MRQARSSAGSLRAELVAINRAFRDSVERSEVVFLSGALGARLDQRDDTIAYLRVLDAIEAISRRDRAAAQQTATRVDEFAVTTEQILTVAIVGSGAGIALGGVAIDCVATQTDQSTDVVCNVLSDGDFDRTVPEFSGDEFGQSARLLRERAGKWDSSRKSRAGVRPFLLAADSGK